MVCTLSELHPGDQAIIRGYHPGEPAYRQKLLSMGLTRGTILRVRKLAPLGDPVEIESRGFRLSLRKAEAAILILEKAAATNHPEKPEAYHSHLSEE
ncbi:FeoA family protein [Spirochaeta lutea]|uniref:FeoA family protein n=1 Tax=Spirochaeta lutea TaxID=1480694 RepID=UPI0006916BA4|nr:FeoA family protein [Spirochaeta lutea]